MKGGATHEGVALCVPLMCALPAPNQPPRKPAKASESHIRRVVQPCRAQQALAPCNESDFPGCCPVPPRLLSSWLLSLRPPSPP
eukprot:scaffold4924_cov207-Pinguiococcus_pyrenoidosus.AAC.1